MVSEQERREQLAALAHEQWSGWMEYLFSKSIRLQDGGVLITPPYAERLRRQMTTSFTDLTEHEKQLDRHEADRVLALLKEQS
jgi:hypothetical protein